MTKASLGRFFAGVVCAVGFAVSLPVFGQSPGASITIVGPGCTQWQLSGQPPNQTLTCVTGSTPTSVPLCTLSGSTTGVTGTPVPLFAKCVPEATVGYVWTGGSCATATGSTCYANEAGAGPMVYTVKGTNGSGTGAPTPGFTVNWVLAPPPTPTGCVFSAKAPASGSLASTGGAVSMTATCSGAVTSWNWTKSAVAWANDGATGSSTKGENLPANTGSAAVNYTYTAQACNGPSCAAAIATTFTVAAPSGGGGGGGGPISCAGFANTWPVTVGGTGWATVGAGVVQMGANDAAVLILNVPTPAGATGSGLFSFYDQYAIGNNRQVTISKTPCTWTAPYSDPYSVSGSSATWTLYVGNSAQTTYGNIYMDPGATYYINIKNLSCAASPFCDMGFQFSKPSGS